MEHTKSPSEISDKCIGKSPDHLSKPQEAVASYFRIDTLQDHDISELTKLIQDNKVIQLGDHSDYTEFDLISTILEANYQRSSFYIVDLGEIVRKFKLWTKLLPTVKPFYAVKCNPNQVICQLMALLGSGFDVASKNEMNIVKELLNHDKIIYAHPYKDFESLQYARSIDIDMSVFDSKFELDKIKVFHPCCKLLLRIKVDDSHSQCRLNEKFGIETDTMDGIEDILNYAKVLGLNVRGVAFHVGSDCSDPIQYKNAFQLARSVFDIGLKYGFKMDMLDIGGGFPGVIDNNNDLFEKICCVINTSLKDYFGDIIGLRVIAEPGRYFVQSSHVLVVNVVGKRIHLNKETNEQEFLYYMNDGVYGSFNCIFSDHQHPEILPYNERNEKKYKSVIFGRTCDSMDKITSDIELPQLEIGDYCYVPNFGAYTVAAASSFNGFPAIESFYVLTS